MSFQIREGQLDVAVVAGPRMREWPTVGARTLSALCAEMGLSVGVYGGPHVRVRGVLPEPGSGGIVFIEDIQNRIHRIRARAVVKFAAPYSLPEPFPGWLSEGLIPISTAIRLNAEARISWHPGVVVLGTSNRAMRFACSILETGIPVTCVESSSQWGGKRYAGWEVELRRFQMMGGRIIEARPIELKKIAPLLWEFRVQDHEGIRYMNTSRVVAVGAYRDLPSVREYPPGSYLFEIVQSAPPLREDNVEGWVLEEERGRLLGARISKALSSDLGSRKGPLDKTYRKTRSRLKNMRKHRELPHTPSYEGKWIQKADAQKIRSFAGVPQEKQKSSLVASIECFEDIPCNLCETACPEKAIQIRRPEAFLNEEACTACGKCLVACPSQTPLLMKEDEGSHSTLVLPSRAKVEWKKGEHITLLNRRGEKLGTGRIRKVETSEGVHLVESEVPSHLVWEARGMRPLKKDVLSDQGGVVHPFESEHPVVEILFEGEKRLVREGINLGVALFETGRARANDVLLCDDGSCGLCRLDVDSQKRKACQTKTRKGMAIRSLPKESAFVKIDDEVLCPCRGITVEQVRERVRSGQLRSPEAVQSLTRVGEGKCHGQFCLGAFRRLLLDEGIDSSKWLDWRFPWVEWAPQTGLEEG